MNRLVETIFPMYANHVDNIKVRNKIDDFTKKQQQSNNALVKTVAVDVYKEQYLDTFKIKDKLEEKAKTNVVGVTIATTLVLGTSGIINTIYDKFPAALVGWVAFGLLLTAVIYMIVAGLLAIKVLATDNRMFFVSPQALTAGDQALAVEYNDCTYLNRCQNIIRNNSVFTSYECIRNSLVCLFLLLILIGIPLEHSNHTETRQSSENYEFFYSAIAVDFLKSNDVQNYVEDIIVNNVINDGKKLNTNTEIKIADNLNNISIKYSYTDGTINVLYIGPMTCFVSP